MLPDSSSSESENGNFYDPTTSSDSEDSGNISKQPENTHWPSLLPTELLEDAEWVHFFSQQVLKCSTYRRWSIE